MPWAYDTPLSHGSSQQNEKCHWKSQYFCDFNDKHILLCHDDIITSSFPSKVSPAVSPCSLPPQSCTAILHCCLEHHHLLLPSCAAISCATISHCCLPFSLPYHLLFCLAPLSPATVSPFHLALLSPITVYSCHLLLSCLTMTSDSTVFHCHLLHHCLLPVLYHANSDHHLSHHCLPHCLVLSSLAPLPAPSPLTVSCHNLWCPLQTDSTVTVSHWLLASLHPPPTYLQMCCSTL